MSGHNILRHSLDPTDPIGPDLSADYDASESQEDVIRRLAPECTCPDDMCLGEDSECVACGEIDPEWECLRVLAVLDSECASCGEDDPLNECPHSERPCGHHCNHIWENDFCHWCHRGLV